MGDVRGDHQHADAERENGGDRDQHARNGRPPFQDQDERKHEVTSAIAPTPSAAPSPNKLFEGDLVYAANGEAIYFTRTERGESAGEPARGPGAGERRHVDAELAPVLGAQPAEPFADSVSSTKVSSVTSLGVQPRSGRNVCWIRSASVAVRCPTSSSPVW